MKIIISIGDCNGIGIEVMLKAIEKFDNESVYAAKVNISVSGSMDIITKYSKLIDFPIKVGPKGFFINNRYCEVLECPTKVIIDFGKVSLDAGKLSAEAIEMAVSKTISGDYDAIVTMPVAKEALYLAGWKYPGHTEMLADACKTKKYMMILCTREIRIALVTIHIPLKDVSSFITQMLIEDKIKIFNSSMIKDFGINYPKIAVLGLNPHAGENGTIGNEENEIIIPAISKMYLSGINVSGPHPSDGFFAHGDYKNYDGILAIYHDQGLIPLKLLAGGGGVNFTAALPIIRTSPDHGTAFAISGKGMANPQSTLDALEMAVQVYKNRNSQIF